jgi:GMP synthase (glutamine-hydrolysing)
MIDRNKMPIKIGIINCYSDEPTSAPSASYFSDIVEDTTIINICSGEKIENSNDYDAYIISGSRTCYENKDSWIKYLREIVKQIYDENIPCLAICFGHQVVADIFGGNTVRNCNGEEGFQDVPTTMGEEAIRLFKGLPNPVKVFQSHNDAVMKAPPGSIQVIYNEKCVQYYQFGSIYSIQSHPEIDITAAKQFAKRDNKDVKIILNGVNEINIRSRRILENFSNIVEKSI